MSDERNRDPENPTPNGAVASQERTFIYRVLRYVPSLLRDEGVNIGVLLYDPITGDRLRMLEEEADLNRVRRLRPVADERFLRNLREHLESRLSAAQSTGNGGSVPSALLDSQGNPRHDATGWIQVLEKWDATLSQSLQLADSKATMADDIDAEIERLYRECVTSVPLARTQVQFDAPRTRPQMRHYMDQVFRQAGLWGRIEKNIPASRYTHDGDPLHFDYSYVRNDNRMRGFIQTVSLTVKPEDVRIFSPVAKAVQELASQYEPRFAPEFTAVTDIPFDRENDDHRFFDKMLRNHGITSIPLDNFAVWAAKLRPMVQ